MFFSLLTPPFISIIKQPLSDADKTPKQFCRKDIFLKISNMLDTLSIYYYISFYTVMSSVFFIFYENFDFPLIYIKITAKFS